MGGQSVVTIITEYIPLRCPNFLFDSFGKRLRAIIVVWVCSRFPLRPKWLLRCPFSLIWVWILILAQLVFLSTDLLVIRFIPGVIWSIFKVFGG